MPELVLRRTLWRAGLRYQKNATWLHGNPDLVFKRPHIAVFCDGDFWHGRNWEVRKRRILSGTNPAYWVAKIEHNMKRDRRHTESLHSDGWLVLRFWESEILNDTDGVACVIVETVRSQSARSRRG